ncbi:conserved hypothetical protein [Paraburkholderia tropica]|uniref:hypothetical protein n=1 Tax=Paraburkholderia tropica TaxID=92647 RepID=UPI001CB05816|nr:hypothetical protein [Paraburkholderia tropica]CAG9195713.1 conserved hypothetical protein [Paraburkholderia tropica]
MKTPRFFWIGETSEIFVAESWQQILADQGQCGTGIESVVDGAALDDDGEEIEWGELDPNTMRMWMWDCDENERPRGLINGNLYDLYALTDGGRFNMPVLFCTQYS